MKILEPGHVYALDWLDSKVLDNTPNLLTFVNRETVATSHPGTVTQDVLRVLIDRTFHCDKCLRWPGNDLIVHHLRMALALHEGRALLRKVEKYCYPIETVAVGVDGHLRLEKS